MILPNAYLTDRILKSGITEFTPSILQAVTFYFETEFSHTNKMKDETLMVLSTGQHHCFLHDLCSPSLSTVTENNHVTIPHDIVLTYHLLFRF